MAWSRFYGTVRGSANTDATRTGKDDLHVAACSKQGRIDIWLQAKHDGTDTFLVKMDQHGSSEGWKGTIAQGTMGVQPDNVVGILPLPTIESFTDEALAAEVKRRFGIDIALRQPEPA